MAVCFRKKPEVEGPKDIHRRVVVRLPGMERLVECDWKEGGHQVKGPHVNIFPSRLNGLRNEPGREGALDEEVY